MPDKKNPFEKKKGDKKGRKCPHCGKPLDSKGYCKSCKRQY